ncbi:hypothetical protein B0T20DRAFT_218615 [Sordaria brevicollis]|uniref:Uncharacterized protein n=1 Tax=Sordaria brevicollis TaxID=83679 RepID=A0AAE0PF49_SORBR|nr:hypothetical protein B0T20DRAFT_218615 [Sordaria brevicollis]
MKAMQELEAQKPIRFSDHVCKQCTIAAPGFGWAAKCLPFQMGDKYDVFDLPAENTTLPIFSIDVLDSWGLEGHTIAFRPVPSPTQFPTRHSRSFQCMSQTRGDWKAIVLHWRLSSALLLGVPGGIAPDAPQALSDGHLEIHGRQKPFLSIDHSSRLDFQTKGMTLQDHLLLVPGYHCFRLSPVRWRHFGVSL